MDTDAKRYSYFGIIAKRHSYFGILCPYIGAVLFFILAIIDSSAALFELPHRLRLQLSVSEPKIFPCSTLIVLVTTRFSSLKTKQQAENRQFW